MKHIYKVDANYPTIYVEAPNPHTASQRYYDAIVDGRVPLDHLKIERVPRLPQGEGLLR